MVVFIHVANVLYLVSYLVRDILWLRGLTVIAALTLMPYFYFQPEILWAPIGWNVLFIGINVYQSYRLLLARRPVQLSESEQRLYRLAFSPLTPRQFKQLMTEAERRPLVSGERVVTSGQELLELMVICDGHLHVESEGDEIAKLEAGKLVGEIAFSTGRKPSVDVLARDGACVYQWSHEGLRGLFKADPELRTAWQRLLITELSGKLVAR